MIDSQPLRQKAQRDYQRVAKQIELAKADSERFHSEDKPLFSQWLSANFGAQLTGIRDLQAKLLEAQDLVNEVQQEFFYGRHASIASAYRMVLHRRAHPPEESKGPGADSENDPANEPEEDPEEAEFRRVFEEAAEEFWQRFQGGSRQHTRPRGRDSHEENQRLKELYRKLARRLHPDNGRAITPRETELWHQTQTAYEHGQVEALETILSMLEIDEKGTKIASISTLLQLTAGLKKNLRSLKRELSALRRDVAWNFSRRDDRSEMLKATEATLHADREKIVWLLTKFQTQIEQWAAQKPANRKRVSARRSTWVDEEWF